MNLKLVARIAVNGILPAEMNTTKAGLPLHSAQPSQTQYSLGHLLYLVLILGASLALFGLIGIVLFAAIAIAWAPMFQRRSRLNQPLKVLSFLALSTVALGLLLLPIIHNAGSSPSPRTVCASQVSQICLALRAYHQTHGSFPPAHITDQNGVPMHSWRVLILPFLGYPDLYGRYNFNEPWNGPTNRSLLHRMPREFACPTCDGSTSTSYVAVVGPRTPWAGSSATRISDYSSGPGSVVLAVESHASRIPWMEPRDLEFDEALELFVSDSAAVTGHRTETFFFDSFAGRNVAFVDKHCLFIPNGAGRRTWSEMLCTDMEFDGRDIWKTQPSRSIARRPRMGNWIRTFVWAALATLPLPWVWLGARKGDGGLF